MFNFFPDFVQVLSCKDSISFMRTMCYILIAFFNTSRCMGSIFKKIYLYVQGLKPSLFLFSFFSFSLAFNFCLSVSLYSFLCLSLTKSLSSLYQFFFCCLFQSLLFNLSQFLFLSFSFSLYLFLSLTPLFGLFVSQFLNHSLSLSQCLAVYVSVSLCLSLSFYSSIHPSMCYVYLCLILSLILFSYYKMIQINNIVLIGSFASKPF